MELTIILVMAAAVLFAVFLGIKRFVLDSRTKQDSGGISHSSASPLSDKELKELRDLGSVVASLYSDAWMQIKITSILDPSDEVRRGHRLMGEIRDFEKNTTGALNSMDTPFQSRYRDLMNDAKALIDISPATYEIIGNGEVRNFSGNGIDAKGFLIAWNPKAQELVANMDKFTGECHAAIKQTGGRVGSLQLSSSRPMENPHISGGLPQVSLSGLSKNESDEVQNVQRRFPELPLIEASRAQRILGNIAQAQELQRKLVNEEKVTTINGEPVDKMVTRIVQGNVRELHEQVNASSVSESRERMEHDLQVLDTYTKNLSTH